MVPGAIDESEFISNMHDCQSIVTYKLTKTDLTNRS